MKPFYSDITSHIAVGSVPLPCDVAFLHAQGVRGVVNMCQEYDGPVERYRALGIAQLHLPTPDLHEPSLSQMRDMIAFIQDLQRREGPPPSATHISNEEQTDNDKSTAPTCPRETRGDKVFIHCKGGRGRAVLAAVCFLIFQGRGAEEAFELVRSKRQVAARAVLKCDLIRAVTEEYAPRK